MSTLLAVAALAATMRGTVLVVSVGEVGGGTFVADAQVRLPSLGRVGRTSWNGEIRFENLPKGKHRVQVRAIGYAPGEIDMQVNGDSAGVHFELEKVAPELDTVRVAKARPQRNLREFEMRRIAGRGQFVTDSILHDDRTRSLQSILTTRLPNMAASGKGVTALEDGKPCRALIFLDAFEVKPIASAPVDLEVIRSDFVAGIEMYSRDSAPPQYRPRGRYCAVVLLWTRW
jgi:hypothetical protein